MRYLQWLVFGAFAVLGLRWAYREGSKPPDEHRQWIWGYDEEGNPIVSDEDEIDVEKTMALNKELTARSRM
jgi:hypothetical protein